MSQAVNEKRQLHRIIALESDLAKCREERDRAIKDVNAINNAFRAAGWGQGEIDSYAVEVESFEKRITALLEGLRRYGQHLEGGIPPHGICLAWGGGQCTCGLSTLIENPDAKGAKND